MFDSRFRLNHLWMLGLLLTLQDGTGMRHQQAAETDRLAKKYQAARAEFQRRDVCIEAIDRSVIARGRSMAVIDTVFGTTYADRLPPAGSELESGVVEFHPLPPPRNDAFASARIGWYLAFEFDSAGKIQNYYVSNIHK